MPGMRIVLDTNVLAPGLAYPTSIPGLIVSSWRRGGLEVVVSHYILDEMVRVLPRLSKLSLNHNELRDLADSLMFLADVVELARADDPALRDAVDQPILATLIGSRAGYLVTGDKDLLALAERYPILSPAAFWTRHGS